MIYNCIEITKTIIYPSWRLCYDRIWQNQWSQYQMWTFRLESLYDRRSFESDIRNKPTCCFHSSTVGYLEDGGWRSNENHFIQFTKKVCSACYKCTFKCFGFLEPDFIITFNLNSSHYLFCLATSNIDHFRSRGSERILNLIFQNKRMKDNCT